MKKRSLYILLVLLTGCGGGKKAPRQTPVAVTVQAAALQAAAYWDEYPGVVSALVEVDIVPQVSGSVTGIWFNDGQQVRKGQKLYSIDQQQYAARYREAQADLAASRANLDKAQKDADRYNYLLAQDAIARQTVDYAMAALETARQQVRSAEQAVTDQAATLSFAEIAAPTDGRIGFSQVKKGATVVAGVTRLNTVSTWDPIGVDFTLNEKQAPAFMQMLQGPLRDSLFTLALPGGERYPAPGKPFAVDRAIDPATATLRVRLSFPNPGEALKPGSGCTVRIAGGDTTRRIVIPARALVEQMGENFVWIAGADSTARLQKVAAGRIVGPGIVIESGLNPGDPVVIEGFQTLHPGAKVTVRKGA